MEDQNKDQIGTDDKAEKSQSFESPTEPALAPVKAEKIQPTASQDDDEEELPEFDEHDEFDEGGSFAENFQNLFGSGRFHFRQIFGCFTLLVILGLLVYVFAFGGGSTLSNLRNYIPSYIPFFGAKVAAPSFSPEKIEITHFELNTAYHFGFYRTNPVHFAPPSIQLALIYGGIQPTMTYPVSTTTSGIFAAYSIGFRGQPLVRFSQYLANISQIQHLLSTDVNAVLNASSNRGQTLDGLIKSFDILAKTSQDNADFVKKEVSTLSSDVRTLSGKLTTADKLFAADTALFLPEKSAQDLDAYMQVARDYADAKARLGSMSKIDQYYQVAMVKLTARIRDVKDNEDALVKGVKVFDIKNSDIHIIIYEGQPPADPSINAIDRSKSGSNTNPFYYIPGAPK